MLRSIVLTALRITAAVPFRINHAIGYGLGVLLAWIPNGARRVTRRNLAYCFPELDPTERRRLERASLAHLARGILELGAVWLWPAHRTLELVREIDGLESLKSALDEGRGAIMLTPHLGAFEITGLFCTHYGPATALFRPSRIGLDQELCRWRGRLGNRLVPTDRKGVLAVRRALERGEVAGILPDQNPPSGGGIFAPFFGIQAYTMTLVSRLAIATGAPVLLIVAERLPHGRGFRVICRRMSDEICRKPVEQSVCAMNREIEAAIRRAPEQYLWSYKRFKKRPDGVPTRY